MGVAIKVRACSFDMAEVPPNGYVLAEEQGEMYFCNARCLCLWAVHFVTNPRRPHEQKMIACDLIMPSGERRKFTDLIEVAQWSAANALEATQIRGLGMELPFHNDDYGNLFCSFGMIGLDSQLGI